MSLTTASPSGALIMDCTPLPRTGSTARGYAPAR